MIAPPVQLAFVVIVNMPLPPNVPLPRLRFAVDDDARSKFAVPPLMTLLVALYVPVPPMLVVPLENAIVPRPPIELELPSVMFCVPLSN